ncbi:MAG: hypothetical protein AAF636_13790 [Pseudomonadota bacterium]
MRNTLIPGLAEHRFSKRDDVLRRRQLLEERAYVTLDPITGDGFAIGLTALGLAEEIGVTLGGAGGPRGAQRRPA